MFKKIILFSFIGLYSNVSFADSKIKLSDCFFISEFISLENFGTPLTTNIAFSEDEICLGFSIYLNALPNGGDGNYTYTWDFGDGIGTSNVQSPIYMYTTAGTFTITLTVTDGTLASAVATLNVIIFDKPVLTSTPDVNNGCAPLTVCFTNNVAGGTAPFSFMTYFGDANSSTAQNSCNIYSAIGTYAQYVFLTDQNGCLDTVWNVITVFDLDDADFYYPQNSFCENDVNPLPTINGLAGGAFSCSTCVINSSTGEIDLNASTTGCHQIIYTTNGPCQNSSMVNICIQPQAEPVITPVPPICCDGTAIPIFLIASIPGGTWSGSGIVNPISGEFVCYVAPWGINTITYTIASTCGGDDTTNIVINGPDLVSIYNNDTIICNNSSGFFLSAESGGTWSGNMVSDLGNGSGFFSASSIPAGTYYAIYTTNGNCPNEDSIQIIVSDTNLNIVESNITICQDDEIIIALLQSPDFIPFEINFTDGGTWDNQYIDTSFFGTFGALIFTPPGPGNYTLYYSNMCNTDSVIVTVLPFNGPTVGFTIIQNSNVFDFTNTTINGDIYEWDFGDGNMSSLENPSNIYLVNGTYTVCLTATDTASGCSSTHCESITITGLGINEFSDLYLNVYPNPSTSNFNIESNSIIIQIFVKNIIGQNVFTKNVNAINAFVELGNVANGFYFIEIETENGKAVRKVEKIN